MFDSALIGAELYAKAYASSHDPILIMHDDKFITCNDAANSLLGFSDASEVIGLSPSDLSPVHQPDGAMSVEKAAKMIDLCYANGMHRFLWAHLNYNKEQVSMEISLVDVSDTRQKMIFCTIRTISKYRSLQQGAHKQKDPVWLTETLSASASRHELIENYRLLNQHKKAIDAAAIVSKTDPQGVITYVNQNFCHASEYSEQELLGKNHRIIHHRDMPRAVYKDLWSTISSGRIWQGIIKNRKKSGKHYYVDSTICPIFGSDGCISEYIAVRYDITAIYDKEEIIQYQHTDQISQLANSTKLFSDILDKFPCYLASVHIPELKDIQSAYMTDIHQQAILFIAKFLTKSLPNAYQIYRCSDNNFAIIASTELPFESFVQAISHTLISFEQSLVVTTENEFSMSMNVGIANAAGPEYLHNNSLLALALAQENGTKLEIYTDDNKIHRQLVEGIEWTKKLKLAIREDNIKIFGQNIYDAQKQCRSTEVLMRYCEPLAGGCFSPAIFLPFAEKAKLYNQLTLIMLRKAFNYFSKSKRRFSVNLTMNDIADLGTREAIYSLIEYYNIGKQLTIELVESTSYESNPELFYQFITQVKSLGCFVAIDDFGSGYSNFEFLTKSSVDIVKIDGSLISNILDSKRHLVIVETIVNFCHALEMVVVAEFVEDQALFERLVDLGIDYFQGYHLHKPTLLAETVPQ